MSLEQLLDNQLLTAGIAVLGVGGIGASLRNVPGALGRAIASRYSVTLRVSNDDRSFQPISKFLAQQTLLIQARQLRLYSGKADKSLSEELMGTDAESPFVYQSLAKVNFFRYDGALFNFFVKREQQQSIQGDKWREEITITSLNKDPRILKNLVADAVRADRANPGYIRVFRYERGIVKLWRKGRARAAGLDYVYLPGPLQRNLTKDVERFLARKHWYMERGIPWRRGYLLYGPPGSGKSSLVAALAVDYDLPLYIAQLDGIEAGVLDMMFAGLPERCILLVEDLDAIYTGRDQKVLDKLPTFSDLLNALDGAGAAEGRLLFVTTNHPNKLDPALVRPGRIDQKIELTWATPEQAQAFFLRFFPSEREHAETFGLLVKNAGEISMARLQEILIQAETNPLSAIKQLEATD